MTKPSQHGTPARKYKNVPTTIDGILFASKAEAKRFCELQLLQRAGAIRNLQLQKRYKLNAQDGTGLCTYVADFDYFDTWKNCLITEDVKGVLTRDFRLKAKMFRAQYGREIVIVRAA